MKERERERERMRRGGTEKEKERERKRIPSRLHTVSAEPNTRLKLTNCEIRPETKSTVGCLTD